MAITQKYMLLCDEVRREDNGKLIILGVYTPDMAVPQFPFTVPLLTFFFCLESDRPGTWTVKFRLQDMDSGRRVFEGIGGIGFPKPGPATNFLKFGNVQFTSAGTYQFVLEIEGQEPLVNSFNVILGVPVPPPTASAHSSG